jgi:dTMP kinase
MPTPGLFIVLDGPEGSGKSTQAARLRFRLEAAGRLVLPVRDPGSTRIGEQIRSILLNPDHQEMAMRCEMLLYMAARAQMMSEIILPALAEGKVVLSDRFVSSTLAYQLGGDALTADDIRTVADIAIRHRWPDLTLIFDMPVEASMARVNRAKDRIEQRPMAYHDQVRKNYLAQANSDPHRHKIIDAAKSPDDVEDQVWRAVAPLLSH